METRGKKERKKQPSERWTLERKKNSNKKKKKMLTTRTDRNKERERERKMKKVELNVFVYVSQHACGLRAPPTRQTKRQQELIEISFSTVTTLVFSSLLKEKERSSPNIRRRGARS